jgi:hypothetical protein
VVCTWETEGGGIHQSMWCLEPEEQKRVRLGKLSQAGGSGLELGSESAGLFYSTLTAIHVLGR